MANGMSTPFGIAPSLALPSAQATGAKIIYDDAQLYTTPISVPITLSMGLQNIGFKYGTLFGRDLEDSVVGTLNLKRLLVDQEGLLMIFFVIFL